MNKKPAALCFLLVLMSFATGDQAGAATLRFAYASIAPPLSGIWAA
jgi:hypothetical protein